MGKIVSFFEDLEHGRILYIITKDAPWEKSGYQFTDRMYGFSKGKLFNFSESTVATGVVNATSKVVPYFSPNDNTQVIIMDQ